MTQAQQGISILEQRRIEAAIVKPIYEVLEKALGVDMARTLIGSAITQAARDAGRSFASAQDGETNLLRFADLFSLWQEGDAYEVEVLAQTNQEFGFNIHRCKYAEMYNDMGMGEIGHLLSCRRDGVFCEGYDPRIKLTRTQTLMEGASHCDFRFSYEAAAPVTGSAD